MHVMGLQTIVIAIFVVYESIVYKAKDGKVFVMVVREQNTSDQLT